ncbi:MAG: hypothetical protein SFZ03_09160 [Candidatus Melainabacteria bacterium]|nr:hypothetical protein [Candidatus Melainabacteria bacterium]
MDSKAFYDILTQQLSERPDLSVVQQRQPIPEDWPVLLHRVQWFRKQVQQFFVSDGRVSVICRSNLPDVYNKIAVLEIGTIIHLIGCETIYDGEHKCYVADVQDVFTLKEYDDRLKAIHQAEAERLARLREQGFLEEFKADANHW